MVTYLADPTHTCLYGNHHPCFNERVVVRADERTFMHLQTDAVAIVRIGKWNVVFSVQPGCGFEELGAGIARTDHIDDFVMYIT